MLIGTWNMQGRWSPAHRAALESPGCDVWLLTEVNDALDVRGFDVHRSATYMAARRRWSAVLTSTVASPLSDPHPASAAVRAGGVTYCATVLPWRSCGQRPPWIGPKHADKTAAAVTTLDAALPAGPLVWGGDWNHALQGTEYAGSRAGRAVVERMVRARQLQVPTATLPHRIDGLFSIDHIAVGLDVSVLRAERFVATALSDHDGYLVEVRDACR